MTTAVIAAIEDWNIGTSPGELLLVTAWLALGIASLILLVMLVFGRGNARHIKTSLMISIMAHCGLALFSDNIPLPSSQIRAERSEPTFEIEEIVFDALDEERRILENERPVWDEFTETTPPEHQRRDYEETSHDLPQTERPERDPDDPEPAALADVPDAEEVPPELPQGDARVSQTPRTADQTSLDNNEETVESRPDEENPSSRAGRRRIDEQGLTKSEIERESRRGKTDDPTSDLRESRRMEVADATADPSSEISLGPNSEAANRRDADAAETLPAEDPGTRAAKRGDEVGRGTPRSRAFSRRKVSGSESDSPSLRSEIERNPQSDTNDSDQETRLSARDGGADPDSDDTRLRLTRNRSDSGDSPRRIARLPATYQLRDADNRQKVAIRHGATKASEEAVENSLQWLAAHQNVEGFWDADGFMAHCPDGAKSCWGPAGRKPHQGSDRREIPKSGVHGDAGLTGLTILAFLGAGYTHEEGVYADQVDRALRWLIRQQTEDGFLGGDATHYAKMYCHGMASIALGEAYGMTQDPTLREPLQKAIDFIVTRQNPKDGGWRYSPGKQGDMSMFGWQLMALKSAETAGLEFPPKTRLLAIDFLVSNSKGDSKGLAAYRLREKVTPAMTAEALFCKQVLGIKRENEQSTTAVAFLQDNLPRQAEQNLYYWYYGTLAMFQYGGQPWEDWNRRVRETLVATQRTAGHAAGSWDPRPPWGDYGGRIYSTVLSTLCLEVYYRFLPMYRQSEAD